MKHRTFASFLKANPTEGDDACTRCRMSHASIVELYWGKRLPSFKEIFELSRAIEESPLTIIKMIQLDTGDYFDLKEELSIINLLGYQALYNEKQKSFDFVRIS